ncbi:MAG: spore coat protein [Erysipelotrichia bacterium]|nr:spore coat protein [Erysipelotrichia bacterium]NCC54268.1 spore coat protein [Erysipelotrichia bacterium]
MKEQDILLNLLISLKHLKAFFNTFSQEASNDTVLEKANNAYDEISTLQRDCYSLMVDLGYMKISNQTQAAIEKEYKKYENKSC